MDNRVAYITNNGVLCNKEERNLNSLASKIHLAFGLCAIAIACVFTQEAYSQAINYPTRPVRMVVPFAPGGASDLVGRIIQHRMTDLLGQQLVIDNRSGAAGNIGVEVVARSNPDGYTLLLGNIGTMAINPSVYPAFPISPTRDFVAVTEVVDVPGALVANLSLPVNNIKELIAYVKARPDMINYGSPSASSVVRLEMEMFMRAAGLKMVHIPYKGGAGPAVTGLLANENQVQFISFSSAINLVKQGRLRLLGVVAPKRIAVVPNTPTLAESGFPSMTGGGWQGVFVPLGTPRAIANRLFAATLKTMEDPNVKQRLSESGVDIVVSKSPEEFAAYVKRENASWAKVVKDANIVAE